MPLIAGRRCMCHGLHHAGRFRLMEYKYTPIYKETRRATVWVCYTCVTISVTYCGNCRLWLCHSNMLWDSARSHWLQNTILHSGWGLRGLCFLLPNPWRLLLCSLRFVLTAAWLALFHAGGARGHSNLGTTHCTLNKGELSLWLENKCQKKRVLMCGCRS